ncbi:MAG: nucleotidyl transferase AbiEii/AbiGii toxin family protein [Elusimicrobia bacterium]|nr:nucleotidyl transferase AbiEii/AbiGii toxin family protein [Elusimicrobiota bacterium]
MEDRLKDVSLREGPDIQRLRRQVAFDRLLARLFAEDAAPWVLKGGYAMELRIREARATRDIDLVLKRAPRDEGGQTVDERIRAALQDSADRDLQDHFAYVIGRRMKSLDAAPYGGARYPVEVRMAGRLFVRFHLDVALGDPVLEPLNVTKGRDWLGFAGISAGRFPTLSAEQYLAEKLHAYTLPRTKPNSRVRDLVDMSLLLKLAELDHALVKKALRAVFDRRKTHPIPATLESPPKTWEAPYTDLAAGCKLPADIEAAFQVIHVFWKGLGLQ